LFSSIREDVKIRLGITGKPRIGKSTVIKEVIGRLKAEGITMGGMLTSDMHERGRRVGFSIEDINSGVKGVLAHMHQRGTKVGKYGVNLIDLDSIGTNSIKAAVSSSDMAVIIVDEIGPMELKSKRFINAIEEVIQSDKHLIVSVHQRSEHELVRRIKRDFEIFVVTEENRDEIAKVLTKKCLHKITQR
jgi:nucleoside-triphosphatase